jgi:hypothetical protein
MRIAIHAAFVTAGLIGLSHSAFAADMTAAQIKTLLSGKTAYLETTSASASGQAGNVVIYWNADGTALYKAPNGNTMHGKWETQGDALCAYSPQLAAPSHA